jgi:hypothetical protein
LSAHEHGAAELDDALRVAARMLAARTKVCAAAAVLCLVAFALVALIPFDYPSWLLLVPALVAAVVGGWIAWTFFPHQKAAEDAGMATNVVDEPQLHAWMADLAHRLGVSAPHNIRLAPSTGAWVSDLSGSPSLVLGTGWLTWLHVHELNRLCALELSMLRVRDDPTIAKAIRLAGGLNVDALIVNSTPVVGTLIRRIGQRFDVHRDAVFDACLSWAAAAIPPDLRPTDAEVGEGRLADEGWQVLSDRWIAPVTELGRGLDALALPHRELLAKCQESDLLERSWDRPSGPPAMTLLKDPVATDADVAQWLAEQGADPDAPPVGWDEYIEQVTLPAWRSSVADVVTAANRVRGSARAMTLDTLLEACESGSAFAVGALLVEGAVGVDGTVSNSQATRRAYDNALGTAFTHAVSLALVETGLATPVVDVLWGVVLEALDGERITVESNVRAFCRTEDWASLRLYVESLDLDPGHRLRLAGTFGDAPRNDGSDLVAVRHGRVTDVVFADGCMRVYPRSIWRLLKSSFERMTGLVPLEDTYYDEPAEDRRIRPSVSIALVEVTSAELFRRPHGLAWTLRLETADERLSFTGVGDGAHVAPILQSAFRGRATVTGLGVRPSRFLRVLGKTGWYVILGGILVLLSGALGYALGTGDQQSGGHTVSTLEAVGTFGVLGASLITLGLIPYMFVARRGHRLA